MYECTGWCVLNTLEDDEETISEKSKKLRDVAHRILERWSGCFAHISADWIAGRCFLHFVHASNHGSAMHPIIDALAEFIVTQAPRSYGVIHFVDSELLPDRGDAFHVIKIVGPNLVREKDALLASVDKMDNF